MIPTEMEARLGSSSSNDVVIGVVGDGFGALQIYATAIYLGFAPEQIGIFGENLNPAQTYQQFAWNLGQTILRSESESHFLPADWPTFGQLTAVAHRDVTPLFRSAVRTLNPGVPAILTEMEIVARELGYERRVLGGQKVGWVVREPDPVPHFSFHNEQGQLLGRATHAAIAIGHGPLAFPGVFGMARNDPATGPYVVQAYEAKRYRPGGVYIVVGSGIAAVNEEVNVLDAGASCIALRRNPHPDEQDLNVPRLRQERPRATAAASARAALRRPARGWAGEAQDQLRHTPARPGRLPPVPVRAQCQHRRADRAVVEAQATPCLSAGLDRLRHRHLQADVLALQNLEYELRHAAMKWEPISPPGRRSDRPGQWHFASSPRHEGAPQAERSLEIG